MSTAEKSTASKPQRITQRRIAELAGVSQATVSLVLNGKADATTRIPDDTRRRVLEVIRETTYVADPAARRLAGVGNNMLGVFTYEHAFPHQSLDFYTPLLTGIEAAAEEIGCDLLVFTSAPVVDGRRRIFHDNNRLRLADGCLLLGREMDPDELARLVESDYPFVAIGRRDAAEGGVPYVGVDYVTATTTLARMALEQGHRDFLYIRLPGEAESGRDRHAGMTKQLDEAGVGLPTITSDGSDLDVVWEHIHDREPTVLVVEDSPAAQALYERAAATGLSVPRDLSMIVLGEPTRPSDRAVDFTRLIAPRAELGSRAVGLLDSILHGMAGDAPADRQMLLPCSIAEGSTLASPREGGLR